MCMRMHSKHRYSYVPICVRLGQNSRYKPCTARFHYKWCQRLNLEDVGGQGHGTHLDYRRKYFSGMYEHLFSQILNLMYVKQKLFFIYAEIHIAL